MFFLFIVASLFFLVKKMMQPGSVVRLVTFGFLVIGVVHLGLRFLPDTTTAIGGVLTTVALLALAGLAAMVAHDYNQGGISRNREELIFVVAFGLVWLTVAVAWKMLGGGRGNAVSNVSQSGGGLSNSGYAAGRLADTGCVPGYGKVCVLEEWFW